MRSVLYQYGFTDQYLRQFVPSAKVSMTSKYVEMSPAIVAPIYHWLESAWGPTLFAGGKLFVPPPRQPEKASMRRSSPIRLKLKR